MKATLEKVSSLQRKLNVEVPAEVVKEAFDKAYKEIQKSATLKGFRQGKAPIALIKSTYGDRVKQDVIRDLIQDTYSSALEQHSLDPIGYPKIETAHFHDDEVFHYSAEFEIRPEVNLKKFENLMVLKEKLLIDEAAMQKIIDNFRESRAEQVPIIEDRPAQAGDIAEVDFEGFIDGMPLENGSATGFKIELGSNRMIPGFEEAIMGMKIGVKHTANLKFPDEYNERSIAGKPVVFNLTLKNLYRKELPAFTDEFVKSMGKYESVDAFKDEVKKSIEEQESKRIKDDLKNRLMKALVQENPVELPQGLLNEQKSMLEADLQNRLREQGLPETEFASYRDKWKEDIEKTAAFMVQSSFLISAIADKMNFKAEESDVDERLSNYAKSTGIDLARIQEFYGEGDRRSRLMFQIMEEKVVDYLISKANITEVEKDKLPPLD